MAAHINRRDALAFVAAAGVAAVVPAGFSTPALAANDAQDLIKAFTGGKTPVEGRITIDAPEIAENGNTVPFTIAVQSPMTAQDYVKDVLIVADGNPRGGVATFHFTPDAVPEANTRIRLGETQNIVAVARMSDGSLFTASRNVKVTIGGCGG